MQPKAPCGIAPIEHALMALYLHSEWNSCAGPGQMLIESSILVPQWPTRWPLAHGRNHVPSLILLRRLILEISQIITEPNVRRKFLGEKIAQILFGFCSYYSKKQNHFISKTYFFLASCISWNVTLQQNSWAQACCVVLLRKTSSRFSLYVGWNTHFYFISSSFE